MWFKGRVIMHVLKDRNLSKQTKLWLYDLFDWKPGDEHSKLPEHKNELMHEDVVARFVAYPNVTVIKGSVPESFSKRFQIPSHFAI